MLNILFEEEEEFLREDDDNNDLSEPQFEETNRNESTNEIDIEKIVDLGPWVLVDNSTLPTITCKFCKFSIFGISADRWDIE